MQRIFFDWSRPFLPSAARYIVEQALRDRAPGSDALDLGKYAYVLPGSRAKRTLEAYVQREIERAIEAGRVSYDWIPPTYLTLGGAPERLYVGRRRIADRLTRLYCERRAVVEFLSRDTPQTRALIKTPPEPNDFEGQLSLAQTFLQVGDELASERRTCAHVAAVCRQRGEEEEAARWESIAELEALYRRELDALGLTDLNIARETALRRQEIGGASFDRFNDEPRQYRLLGAVDLNRQQKEVFAALGERVQAWVFAPEAEAARFDEFGCVVPDKWDDFELPIDDSQFFQVASPVEQGEATALLTRELSKVYEPTSDDGRANWRYEPIEPEALTIGVPDPEVAPFVARYMSELGYTTIVAEGTSTSQNRVFQLLRNIADYLETRSFASFEELARRPDFEAFLEREQRFVTLEENESEPAQEPTLDDELDDEFDDLGAEDVESNDVADESTSPEREPDEDVFSHADWLVELDRYRAQFLPTRLDGRWFAYENEDQPTQNSKFRMVRKAAAILDRALEPFWDASSPRVQRVNVDLARDASGLDVLKLNPNDFERARDALISGDLEFVKDDFNEKYQWTTNQSRATLRDWAPRLSNLLCKIYANDERVERDRETTAQIDGFFKLFNEKLNALDAIPSELSEPIVGSSAIRAILKELGSSVVPPAPGSDLVEMQGWLDLAFDDAPNLLLTGFNEHSIPTSRSSDLFLPNETRRMLGLSDAKRSFARDAYLTAALANSKRNFFVVFGRRALQGDPRSPSRFAFATALDKIPARMCRFFSPDADDLAPLRDRQRDASGAIRPFPLVEREIEPVDDSTDAAFDALRQKTSRVLESQAEPERVGFFAPTLDLPTQAAKARNKPNASLRANYRAAPDLMRVTDFADFLTSPYRYFLKNVYKLRASADPTTGEMNAAAFGTFAHDVLRDFGRSDLVDCQNERELAKWLSDRLDQHAARFFNENTSPFARVQIEQIRGRLEAFARWQAAWRRSGRVVKFVETGPQDGWISLDVGDGRPVLIVGRIDRVDYSPRENRWYVFDYKTFDSAKTGSRKTQEGFEDGEASIAIDGVERRLLSTRSGNVVDAKHRVKAKDFESSAAAFLKKYGLEPFGGGSDETTDESPKSWTNLQLPLYRRLFWKILEEYYEGTRPADVIRSETKLTLGYVVLPKSGEVEAYGAPWTADDLRGAEATVSWVVRTIRKLWGVVRPETPIDPNAPALGPLLSSKPLPYPDEYAPITLNYLSEG